MSYDTSLLDSLKKTGLSRRVAGLGDMNAALSGDIAEQQNILNKRLEEAQAPKKISLEDALVSAAIQIAPALIGAVVSGSDGALAGLQGGQVGGEIYNKFVDDELTQEREMAKTKAIQADKDLQALKKRSLDLEDRAMDLTDYGVKQADKAPSSLDRLANALEGKLFPSDIEEGPSSTGIDSMPEGIDTSRVEGGEDAVLDPETGQITYMAKPSAKATPSTSPAPTTEDKQRPKNTEKIVDYLEGTDEGGNILVTDPKASKSQLDIAQKSQSISQGETEGKIKKIDLAEKTVSAQDTKEKQAEADKPILIGKTFFRPVKSEIQIDDSEKARELRSKYGPLLRTFEDIDNVIANTSRFSRPLNAEAQSKIQPLREQLATLLSEIRGINNAKDGNSTKIMEQIRQSIPQMNSLTSAIINTLRPFAPTEVQQFRGMYSEAINNVASRLKDMGYEPVDLSSVQKEVVIYSDGSAEILIEGQEPIQTTAQAVKELGYGG